MGYIESKPSEDEFKENFKNNTGRYPTPMEHFFGMVNHEIFYNFCEGVCALIDATFEWGWPFDVVENALMGITKGLYDKLKWGYYDRGTEFGNKIEGEFKNVLNEAKDQIDSAINELKDQYIKKLESKYKEAENEINKIIRQIKEAKNKLSKHTDLIDNLDVRVRRLEKKLRETRGEKEGTILDLFKGEGGKIKI